MISWDITFEIRRSVRTYPRSCYPSRRLELLTFAYLVLQREADGQIEQSFQPRSGDDLAGLCRCFSLRRGLRLVALLSRLYQCLNLRSGDRKPYAGKQGSTHSGLFSHDDTSLLTLSSTPMISGLVRRLPENDNTGPRKSL